jgi:hypothetical protein
MSSLLGELRTFQATENCAPADGCQNPGLTLSVRAPSVTPLPSVHMAQSMMRSFSTGMVGPGLIAGDSSWPFAGLQGRQGGHRGLGPVAPQTERGRPAHLPLAGAHE